MPTTGCENSDKDCRHSEKLTSEGEAGHAKQQEEGCDLQDTMQGLPLCVHWRDREYIPWMLRCHHLFVCFLDIPNTFGSF